MIRVVLGHHGALLRGALATVMSQEENLEVPAEVESAQGVVAAVARTKPDVVVLDASLADELVSAGLCEPRPGTGLLILIDRDAVSRTCLEFARLAPRIGFIATDASTAELVEAVRSVAKGEPVIDPVVALAALRAEPNPLTGREQEVLRLVSTGATGQEIAHRLNLSSGTVRNYLSHILAKVGARSRIEAVLKAQEAGWI
ncbi:response regulator transcription factor [Kribbella pittospori]|uniref:Response regulator transcription factor n=1 Tax=Kribbella pittospori TaxID=722689 RepID=A0A4R0KKD9_9ACTN|nr:response regulator transcription factor [Kribbella pittospori]TCC61143.1 response regulator transcription factor [Kribbella pittospori]